MSLTRFLQISFALSLFIAPSYASDQRPQPEVSSGVADKVATAKGQKYMIVTANEHATKAGEEILRRGGSAMDAAIAAQLVLGLVEPQSSGLGGGAFALYYDAKTGKLSGYDGRETSPGLNGPFLFQENGKAMDFKDAQLSGKSVGVPGLPKMLYDMYERHGTATWMELFEDAIRLSRHGFEISPRLAAMIEAHKDDLAKYPVTALYFLNGDGSARKAGDIMSNPDYEATLKDFAFYGSKMFYEGGYASDIVQAVQNAPAGAGAMTIDDLQSYEVKMRDPVCGPYRAYIVCSMGQPSSGGLTILQALGMMERFDLQGWGADDARSWSVLSQASALAFADRNKYMADPDFVNTPDVLLLDPDYIAARSKLIDPAGPLEVIEAGTPPLWNGPLYAKGSGIDKPGTTHISVIDTDGNIVTMTSTIESAFGSHNMVRGFLLNNELTDFDFTPFDADQNLVANMVEGGKRPRSSMSPTIVFDAGSGKPVLVIGSAGGSRIIGYVLQRLVAVLDWNISIDDALSMQHILARSGKIELEQDGDLADALKAQGHDTQVRDLNSGLTAIQIEKGILTGAADPRREGAAMGQ